MLTNAGLAVFAARIESGTALFGGNFYMALSPDTSALSATDTALPSGTEITGNGLSRVACTFQHTAGTKVWTATNTFTYTGSTTVNVSKIGIFDAASGGNLIAEYLAASPTSFNNAGDNATFSGAITA